MMNKYFLILFFLAIAPLAMAEAEIEGHWRGHIELPGDPIPFSITVWQTAEGAFSGEFSAPGRNLLRIPLSEVVRQERDVRFTLSAIAGEEGIAKLSGQMDKDGKIRGTYSQGGQGFVPFVLVKMPVDPVAEARDRIDSLESEIAAAMQRWGVPGVAVAVVREAEVVTIKTYGNRDDAQRLTPQTIFPLGELSEVFTAFLVGALFDEGKVSWDTPIVEVLPDFRLAEPRAKAAANLKDFLAHRTGLGSEDRWWRAHPKMSGGELLATLATLPGTPRFREAFAPSTTAYSAVATLLERWTGESWSKLMHSRVFDPLAMSNTRLGPAAAEALSPEATGYDRQGDRRIAVEFPFSPATISARGVASSAEDLTVWIRMVLEEGRFARFLLSYPATIREQLRPQVLVPTEKGPPRAFGLGWFLDSFHGRSRAWQGSESDGFATRITLLPDEELGIVVLTNSQEGAFVEALSERLAEICLDLPTSAQWSARAFDRHEQELNRDRQMRQDLELFRERSSRASFDLDRYAGIYTSPSYGFLKVARAGDRLRLTWGESSGELEHWQHDEFRMVAGSEALQNLLMEFTRSLGSIDGLRVRLEPSLPPSFFARQVDERFLQAEYLKSFGGTYKTGDKTISVAPLEGGRLWLGISGESPIVLEASDEQAEFRDSARSIRVRFTSGFVEAAGLVVNDLQILRSGKVLRAERVH